MLSFISLHPENWQQHSYIAMNGVYESAVLTALENHSGLRRIYLCTDNDEGGIDAAERLRDILIEHKYTDIYRITPQNKDWNEDLKARNGAEYLPAAPHKRKEIYLRNVAKLTKVNIKPNRIAADLMTAYNSANHTRLAEFSLAASEHFLKIAGSELDFDNLKECLGNGYKAYLDKGGLPVKSANLRNTMNDAINQLKNPAQTVEELKHTARLLYRVADSAVRIVTEEALIQDSEQNESSEKSHSDEHQTYQTMSC